MPAKLRDLPLFLQVAGLLFISTLVTQALSIVLLFYSPPPVSELYAVPDIVASLRYPSTEAAKHGLTVSTSVAPPHGQSADRRARVIGERIARALSLPSHAIRVSLGWRPGPPWLSLGLAPKASEPPLSASSRSQRLVDVSDLVVAPFHISIRQPDGTWLSAEPSDDGFLIAWRRSIVKWLVASTVLVIGIGYFFARRLTAPLRSFAEAAERLGRDPRAATLAIEGSAEVGVAAQAFNDMKERLRRYVENRTQMIGAIAHDLYTPLQRLAFRLEAAPSDLRAKATADIAEMEAMLNATMAFVRDATRTERCRLELTSIVESVVDNMIETGADVEMEPSPSILIQADAVGVRNLLSNLLVNAVKYGVSATARVFTEKSFAVIEIDDQGPGLPVEELGRVFEPFYRVERSRSRETGGVGLGLSVVRSIALAHGGNVDLINLPGGGLRARATLPL
jgi:signal transduction histidine kinase